MASTLEQAKRNAGLQRYEDLDLSAVRVTDGESPHERAAAPVVREQLKRIARIRKNYRADNGGLALGAPGQLGGTIIVGPGF